MNCEFFGEYYFAVKPGSQSKQTHRLSQVTIPQPEATQLMVTPWFLIYFEFSAEPIWSRFATSEYESCDES